MHSAGSIANAVTQALNEADTSAAVEQTSQLAGQFLGLSPDAFLYGARQPEHDHWNWDTEDPTCRCGTSVTPHLAKAATEALHSCSSVHRTEDVLIVARHYLDDHHAIALTFPASAGIAPEAFTKFLDQVTAGLESHILATREQERDFSMPPLPSTNLQSIAEKLLQRFSHNGFPDAMISVIDRSVVRAIAGSGCFSPIKDLTWRPLMGKDILVQAIKAGRRLDVLDCWAADSHCDKYALAKCTPKLEQMVVLVLRTASGFGWKRSGVFGTIQIACRFPLTSDQEQLLQRLQSEASESLCFAAAAHEAQTEAKLRGLQAKILLGTGNALQQPCNLDQALDELLQHTVGWLGASAVSVHLRDDRFGCTYCRTGIGRGWRPERALERIPVHDQNHPLGWVIAKQQPLLNPDMTRPDYPCRTYAQDIRSFCAVPIHIRKEVQGALLLESDSVRAFTVSDIAVLAVLAGLIGGFVAGGDALALDRARSDITAAFASDDPWEKKLKQVVEAAAHATRADNCSVFLKDDFEASRCVLRATTSESLSADLGRADYIAGEGRTGWVARTCQPLRLPARISVDDARRVYGPDLHFYAKYIEHDDVRTEVVPNPDISYLAVPIPAPATKKCWGVIRCAVQFHGKPIEIFSPNREYLLQRIASELGAALDRRLFQGTLAQQRAEATKQALRNATERVAHKLKNPVAFLLSAVDNCLHDLPPNTETEVSEQLARIASYARRIGQVADELTKFLMPPKVQLEPLDLAAFVREIVTGACTDTGYEAIITHPPPSWPLLHLDRSLCQSILEEVVRNAQLAMPEGGRIIVEFTGPHDPDKGPFATMPMSYVTLAIADTGLGVPADIKPVLFQPYRTTQAQGSGLGLAIVKNYTLALGGEVREDGPGSHGHGARFRFAFPVHLQTHHGAET